MRSALLLLTVALTGCATNRMVPTAPLPPESTRQSVEPIGLIPPSSMRSADPIVALVARLSMTHGSWVNGLTPIIDLPATASTDQVLELMFKAIGFNNGYVTSHQIVETRQVYFYSNYPDTTYTAVLVETNLGRKVVLLKPPTSSLGWWSRTYDI